MIQDKYILLICFLAVLLVATSCGGESPERKERVPEKEMRESLLEANKQVVKTEEQHIEDFLARYKWDMKETGTGLRYMVYERGEGQAIETGDLVEAEFELRLITGDLVYSSAREGNMVFTVGKAEVISGLEQGILLLHVGDKAKFIIPSHLAYGLLGDDNKIPTKATLIYDIHVIQKK